jgi:hypothetical protein
MFDPFRAFEPIRRHKQRPSCSHLGELIDDVVSVFEDMQNHYMQLLERHMSAIVDKLLGAVQDLGKTVEDHDAAVMAAVAQLKTAQDAGDDAGVQTAIDAISAASGKLKDETAAITSSMTAATSVAATSQDGNGGANQPAPAAPVEEKPAEG